MNSAVSCRQLTRSFGEKTAVDSLDLDVARGEIFGLLGHNGAGKTTTVRLLNGLLEPSSGEVTVLGLAPLSEGSELRRRTGVSTETPSLDERMTGLAALRYFADLYGVPRKDVESRCLALLATFGLEEAARLRIGGYSKGMKQRLALARTLLHEPELLFLDEPTSGLDPVAARSVNELITDMSRAGGRTVLLCTHNLAQAQELCDRVAVLEHGRLVASGTPRELAAGLTTLLTVELEVGQGEGELALQTLQQVQGAEVDRQSDLLRVSLSGRNRIPELVARLVTAGMSVYSVNAQEPSLADVYFALHGEDGDRE